MRGANTGRKENPGLVAKKVKSTFKKEEWLTSQQVASYFSRLAAQQKCGRLTSEVCEMDILVDQMNNRRRIREKIVEVVDI